MRGTYIAGLAALCAPATLAQQQRPKGLLSCSSGAVKDDPQCAALGSVLPAGEAGSGRVERVGDMDMYMVGTGKRAIILVYDIYGFSPANTRRNCDLLAEAGFLVVMPDFFRGSGRGQPGFERPESAAVDTQLLEKVVPYVRATGVTSMGLLGFCFGGGMAMRVAGSGAFAAVGGVHATGLAAPTGEQLAAKATVPFMLLQAGNDPSLEPVAKALEGLPSIQARCVLRQYWDRGHGWCGASPDRAADADLRAAVEDALGTTIKFFDRNLPT